MSTSSRKVASLSSTMLVDSIATRPRRSTPANQATIHRSKLTHAPLPPPPPPLRADEEEHPDQRGDATHRRGDRQPHVQPTHARRSGGRPDRGRRRPRGQGRRRRGRRGQRAWWRRWRRCGGWGCGLARRRSGRGGGRGRRDGRRDLDGRRSRRFRRQANAHGLFLRLDFGGLGRFRRGGPCGCARNVFSHT